jgi:hypothetical protein
MNSKKQLPLAIMTNCCTAGLTEVSQGPGSTSCLLMAVEQQHKCMETQRRQKLHGEPVVDNGSTPYPVTSNPSVSLWHQSIHN